MAAKARKRSTPKQRTPKPKGPRTKTTTAPGARSTTRTRRGSAKGGLRSVTRTHTKARPSFGQPTKKASTTRTAKVATKGGLKRTATVTKTTTGKGANRVAKKTRMVTRIKNGRKVVRKVTTINRGGKVTVKRSKPKVTGKGPKSTTSKKPRVGKARKRK